MLTSFKQLVLLIIISFISVMLLSYFSYPSAVSLSENQMNTLALKLEKLIKENHVLSTENTQKTTSNTNLKQSHVVQQAQPYPTLKDIQRIVQLELSNIKPKLTSPQQHDVVTTKIIKNEQYQQSLNDSNLILSKVLDNQKLTNEERNQWGQDHARLSSEDQRIIIDKIVTAINNQELHLEEALDLPF